MRKEPRKKDSWFKRKKRERGLRALERQLDYQEKKALQIAGHEQSTYFGILNRANAIRERLNKIQPIKKTDKILEVGSGAHGLIFGFQANTSVGIDPLAVEYKRLFPVWNENQTTVSAIGENLPFSDNSFEVVLSDNVIDHAEDPFQIIKELARVIKPGGILYFTVNTHHPIYQVASNLHGFWNAIGIKYEISPFADRTIHFTEKMVLSAFENLPFTIIEKSSSADRIKKANKKVKPKGLEANLKKVFFKNALLEIIARSNK